MKDIKFPIYSDSGVEMKVVSEYYFTGADGALGNEIAKKAREFGNEIKDQRFDCMYGTYLGRVTFCVMEFENDLIVTGVAYCSSKDEFDENIYRTSARIDAVQKIWPLMGQTLKD